MKEEKIINLIENLKRSLNDINEQLLELHNNGVEFVFTIKMPYETKSSTKIEMTKATKYLDYLKNE